MLVIMVASGLHIISQDRALQGNSSSRRYGYLGSVTLRIVFKAVLLVTDQSFPQLYICYEAYTTKRDQSQKSAVRASFRLLCQCIMLLNRPQSSVKMPATGTSW